MAIIGLVGLTLSGCFSIVEGGPEPAGDLSVDLGHYRHSSHLLRVHEDATFELAPADVPILCRGTLSQAERGAWRRVLRNYREDDDGVTILPGRHASFTPEGGERWRRLQEPPDELMRFIDDFVQGIPNRPNTVCAAATDNWTIELSFGVDYDAWQEGRVIRLSAEEFVQQSERSLFFDPNAELPFEPCDERALGDLRDQVTTYIEHLAERSVMELGGPSRWWNSEPLALSPNVVLSHHVTYLTTDSDLAGLPRGRTGRHRTAIFEADEAFVRTLVNAALEHCPAPE